MQDRKFIHEKLSWRITSWQAPSPPPDTDLRRTRPAPQLGKHLQLAPPPQTFGACAFPDTSRSAASLARSRPGARSPFCSLSRRCCEPPEHCCPWASRTTAGPPAVHGTVRESVISRYGSTSSGIASARCFFQARDDVAQVAIRPRNVACHGLL